MKHPGCRTAHSPPPESLWALSNQLGRESAGARVRSPANVPEVNVREQGLPADLAVHAELCRGTAGDGFPGRQGAEPREIFVQGLCWVHLLRHHIHRDPPNDSGPADDLE